MPELDVTAKQCRALRDMADGHLTLYAQIAYFDGYSGEPLAEPLVFYVGHNRPDVPQDWWKPFHAAGLIAFPERGCGNRRTVTDAGRMWLAEHEARTGHDTTKEG